MRRLVCRDVLVCLFGWLVGSFVVVVVVVVFFWGGGEFGFFLGGSIFFGGGGGMFLQNFIWTKLIDTAVLNC